jgi:aryl-alcohol dehydrogenase-like predicted oxidoreductase
MYGLVKRTAEIEMLPLARDRGLGVISYSPLGGGLLTGKYGLEKKANKGRLATNEMYAARYGEKQNFRIAAKLSAYAAKAGVHPSTLAVAWVSANPAITAPIIGARNVEQLEASLAAADYEMSPKEYERLASFTPPVPVATDRTEERA